jgi:hypothetical protein
MNYLKVPPIQIFFRAPSRTDLELVFTVEGETVIIPIKIKKARVMRAALNQFLDNMPSEDE